MKNKKTRNPKTKLIRKVLFDKRAISVALSTMIITAGVIAAGIAVLYWAYTWGNLANQQYSETVTNNQNSIGENIAFEYVTYHNNQLTVYILNCGLTNGVTLVRLYLWNSTNQLMGTYDISQLYNTTNPHLPIPCLDKGDEGYFNITPSQALNSGYYTLRVVTGSGRNFDESFSF
jgi:hypothetical protein